MRKHTKRTGALVALAAGAAVALPAGASAHSSTPLCPTVPGGPFTATNDPGYGTPTVTVLPDGRVRLTWADGYSITRPAPTGCVLPPAPLPPAPPAPPVPPANPLPPAPPAPPPADELTCDELLERYPGAGPARRIAWGCPVPPDAPPLRVRKREVTIRAVACVVGSGVRAYSIRRTVVTWTRAGVVVQRRTSSAYRVRGPLCRTPAVTG